MTGPWDSLMKRLVGAKPEHFAHWLAATATFVKALDIELKSKHIYADALLQVLTEGKLGLLHIEFQTDGDANMGVRLMEYNMLASRQYERCPVTTYAIYLRKGVTVATSPLIRPGIYGEEAHRFHFQVIKLWEVPAETIQQLGWIGLLPLVTLTEGGKRPEVVKNMIETLAEAEETDLMAMAQVVGGLVFTKHDELAWFKRRFAMFQDILRESWVYQEIGQEYLEKGLEQGREEGLEKGLEKGLEAGRLEGQRQTIISFVQMHFAEVTEQAQQETAAITDAKVLQALTLKLFAAQTVEEAKRILFEVNKH